MKGLSPPAATMKTFLLVAALCAVAVVSKIISIDLLFCTQINRFENFKTPITLFLYTICLAFNVHFGLGCYYFTFRFAFLALED